MIGRKRICMGCGADKDVDGSCDCPTGVIILEFGNQSQSAPAPTPTLVEGVEELTKQFGSMNRDEFNAMVIEPTYGWNPFVKAMATVMNALTKEKRLAPKRDAVIEAAESLIVRWDELNRSSGELDMSKPTVAERFLTLRQELHALKDEEAK